MTTRSTRSSASRTRRRMRRWWSRRRRRNQTRTTRRARRRKTKRRRRRRRSRRRRRKSRCPPSTRPPRRHRSPSRAPRSQSRLLQSRWCRRLSYPRSPGAAAKRQCQRSPPHRLRAPRPVCPRRSYPPPSRRSRRPSCLRAWPLVGKGRRSRRPAQAPACLGCPAPGERAACRHQLRGPVCRPPRLRACPLWRTGRQNWQAPLTRRMGRRAWAWGVANPSSRALLLEATAWRMRAGRLHCREVWIARPGRAVHKWPLRLEARRQALRSRRRNWNRFWS
mmetsp:Transcript_35879/g.115340  ORF Transcript_35879/g.115340 Transcript_35879/m.115340 type:complete len:278 (-) Transcript_35879:833-1666(-)